MFLFTLKNKRDIIKNIRGMTSKIEDFLFDQFKKEKTYLKKYIINKYFGSETGVSRLKTRTGNMQKAIVAVESYTFTSGKKQAKVDISLGDNTVYSNIHIGTKGGYTIISGNGKKLAIPIAYGRKAAPLDTSGKYQSPFLKRSAPFLMAYKPKDGGETMLIDRVAWQKNKQFRPYYVLKDSVKVPYRIHPEEIEEQYLPIMLDRIDDNLKKYISKK